MSNKRTLKGDIVKQYCEDFKKTNSRALSRILMAEQSEFFTDTEDARAAVRYYRGKLGEKNRVQATNAGSKVDYIPTLPKEEPEEWKPFKLPKACDNILILSDIHFPYHSEKALQSALDYGKSKDVNTILLNGDILDCYMLSSFQKDPRKRGFKHEVEQIRQFFEYLRFHFPKCTIYYKLGNHEERYERIMINKAPEFLGMQEFELSTILRLAEYGIIPMENSKQIVQAGKLNIVHGHEFGKSVFSPVNPARGLFMRAKEHILAGHNHQTSEHTEPTLNGKIITTFSTGALCQLHPDYMPINKWNHGFAIVTVDKVGNFDVENLKIIDGRVY